MRKLSHNEIAQKRHSSGSLSTAQRLPIVVVVDSVRSLYNVGSIFRTSDGALIEQLILAGFTPHPPRKEIEKTALGATASVPWNYVKDPAEAVTGLRSKGYKIVSLELTDASIPYFNITTEMFPLCLVIGNEITGVSKELIAMSDVAVEIPMVGMKQSLNVAVAYGIAVFELMRVWRNRTSERL